MAAALGSYTTQFAERQLAGIEEDPWNWASRSLIKAGLGLIGGGLVMGTAGYFLSANATKAANQEKQIVANIGTIFSNIKAPSWKPAAIGTAPLSASIEGVQNFASDAVHDIEAGASDVAQIGAAMGTLGEDLAIGFIDMAKAGLAFTLHFPDILWNGLVWGVGGAFADFLNWVFPWVVLLGAFLLLAGVVMLVARKAFEPVRAGASASFAKWSSRQTAKVEAKFDRLLRNPAPPTIEAAPAAGAPRPEPEGRGGEVSEPSRTPEGPATPEPPASPVLPEARADAPAPPAVNTPAEISTPTPPPVVQVTVAPPPPGVPTRTELEDHLGEVPNRAPTPEEMARMLVEAEANRRASMPKGPSGFEEMHKAAQAFAEAEATE